MGLRRLSIGAAALLVALSLSAGAFAAGEEALEEMTGIKVGEKAPDFSLKDINGKEHSLSGLLKQEDTVALVFFRSSNW